MKIAMIQMEVIYDKEANIRHAVELIDNACEEKPDFVVLTEMFCCPTAMWRAAELFWILPKRPCSIWMPMSASRALPTWRVTFSTSVPASGI